MSAAAASASAKAARASQRPLMTLPVLTTIPAL
jgi:hypothetical protein